MFTAILVSLQRLVLELGAHREDRQMGNNHNVAS